MDRDFPPRIDYDRAHRNYICLLAGMLAPLVQALTNLMKECRRLTIELGKRQKQSRDAVKTCRYECAETGRLTDGDLDLIEDALDQLVGLREDFHAVSDNLAGIRDMLTELMFYGEATIHQPEAWMRLPPPAPCPPPPPFPAHLFVVRPPPPQPSPPSHDGPSAPSDALRYFYCT